MFTTLGQLPGRDQEGGGCYGNQGILRGDWGPGTLVWVGFCVRSGGWVNLTSPLYFTPADLASGQAECLCSQK